MTDTTCPSCDAPAPARARRCASCGYRFVEDGGSASRPRLGRKTKALTAAGLAVAAAAAAVVLLVGGDEDQGTRVASPIAHLEVLSDHPLAKGDTERLLEERFLPAPDDDGADVRCSRRVARPAHSVRRCYVIYPGGTHRKVVVLTNARGAEVLSEP
jgi:hypothetical protein